MEDEIKNVEENKEQEKMTIDQVLTNLKVISQIKKGEKIVTNNIILEIDNRYFQFAPLWPKILTFNNSRSPSLLHAFFNFDF